MKKYGHLITGAPKYLKSLCHQQEFFYVPFELIQILIIKNKTKYKNKNFPKIFDIYFLVKI